MDQSSNTSSSKTSWLQKVVQWAEKLIDSKYMLLGVGVASFLESILVPIPLEAVLIPLLQARRKQMLWISSAALIGCLLGASLGYAVGYFIFEQIGPQLVELVASQQSYERVVDKMHAQGFWFIFSVGVTPIPFQIAMLAAGSTQYAFGLFLLASGLSRAIRYYGLAVLVALVGDKAEALFKQYKTRTSLLVLAVVVIVWLLLR